jgi:hypothetical protein
MKRITALTVSALLSSFLLTSTDANAASTAIEASKQADSETQLQAQIDALTKKLAKIKEAQQKQTKTQATPEVVPMPKQIKTQTAPEVVATPKQIEIEPIPSVVMEPEQVEIVEAPKVVVKPTKKTKQPTQNEDLNQRAFMQAQIDALTSKLAKIEKAQKNQNKKISEVNRKANNDNLKFDVDFRTAYDNLNYDMVSGKSYTNDALYTNRLWLGMGYAPTKTMFFKGQLSVNKAYGASFNQRSTGFGFDTFDWIINEQLTDDTLKLREAYWLWMPTVGDYRYTVSVGRRPATNGYLINLRDDDKAKSPIGHIINMEFDGASASIQLDSLVSGMYLKLCLGRGLTNATAWASQASGAMGAPAGGSTQPNYTEDDTSLDNTDLIGVIFKPYDNGQYSVMTKFYRGFSVPGMAMNPAYDGTPTNGPMMMMQTFGDMDGAAISAKVEGIGDEITDFLDETIIFASFAWSQTNPDGDQAMLGSTDKESGSSFWIGTQMPNMTGGRFGLEYNHGSKYWRPFTYGEDTMIGSKMAVRGSAYEAYWTQPLISNKFSMQIRYTYLDYDYTGSDAFFGDAGTPMSINQIAQAQSAGMPVDAVETAQDIRVYFRYRY